MNAGPASWFLCGSLCNNFGMLYEKKIVYEELQRNVAPAKSSRALVNVVIEYIPWKDKEKPLFKTKDHHLKATTSVLGVILKTTLLTLTTRTVGLNS